MTPDVVDSRIGTLRFVDGVPTSDTAQNVFDHLDFIRGVEVFLNCIPAASIEAMRLGLASIGVDACNKLAIADRMMDSNPLFLTGNTDTVYAHGFLNLETEGPVVVEVPPGCGPGTVNDAWFRFVTDMGGPGPDRGQGGKYLILPPGFDGDIPDGYFVSQSTSFMNWIILRGFLVDGKPDAAVELFTQGVRIYPLATIENPPAMEFVSFSETEMNTIHANNYAFYEEVAPVIHREPVDMLDPETRGLLASIGIVKDKPFAPDARMQTLLQDAVAVGNATARSIFFHSPDPDAYLYDDRQWGTFFLQDDYRWLLDDGRGGRYLDARTLFFYIATVNTPAMALKLVGAGSQYTVTTRDKNADFLDGSQNYRLRIPADAPAKDFWSLCAYDTQTRSELQTSQPYPSLNSGRDAMITNDDGSVDILFGPDAPATGHENWIQTVAGKGWFLVLRLYGPLEPWFDKTWGPGDLEQLD